MTLDVRTYPALSQNAFEDLMDGWKTIGGVPKRRTDRSYYVDWMGGRTLFVRDDGDDVSDPGDVRVQLLSSGGNDAGAYWKGVESFLTKSGVAVMGLFAGQAVEFGPPSPWDYDYAAMGNWPAPTAIDALQEGFGFVPDQNLVGCPARMPPGELISCVGGPVVEIEEKKRGSPVRRALWFAAGAAALCGVLLTPWGERAIAKVVGR